jgi:hypothetical protein
MSIKHTIRRILREGLINESIFFLRRFNSQEFERLLPINADQVYYETESYNQFKYELTLRALEAMLYNEYGLGYEDLPEQEEIDFINKLSDKYEETIEDLYDVYNKTKSTNKEFNKYKNSKFHTLRQYTFQDIVDNWDELSNHKNHNIQTIKFFVENPDEITELTYDEKGLEDGYHRLIASKILNKPKVKYKMLKEDTNKKQNAIQVYIDEYGLKKTIEEFGSLFSVAKKLNLTPKELFEKYNIIDEAIEELKRTCERNDEDNEYVSYSACDFIEVLTEVEIVDIKKDNTIELKLRYQSIFNYLDEYSFIYELKHELKNYGDFEIEVIYSINTRSNRQW